MAKLKIKQLQSNAFSGPSVPGAAGYGGGNARAANVVVDVGYPQAANSLVLSTIGVVGGANGLGNAANTTGTQNVISCIARIPTVTTVNGNTVWDGGNVTFDDGFIIRQKGKHKFLVGSVGNASYQTVCVLANVADGNASNLPNVIGGTANTTGVALPTGTMAIQGVTAGSANIAIYAIVDKHVWGFPTDYVSPSNQGNLANSTQYYGSYGNANATVQPGPGAGTGTATANGIYAIIDVANQA